MARPLGVTCRPGLPIPALSCVVIPMTPPSGAVCDHHKDQQRASCHLPLGAHLPSQGGAPSVALLCTRPACQGCCPSAQGQGGPGLLHSRAALSRAAHKGPARARASMCRLLSHPNLLGTPPSDVPSALLAAPPTQPRPAPAPPPVSPADLRPARASPDHRLHYHLNRDGGRRHRHRGGILHFYHGPRPRAPHPRRPHQRLDVLHLLFFGE